VAWSRSYPNRDARTGAARHYAGLVIQALVACVVVTLGQASARADVANIPDAPEPPVDVSVPPTPEATHRLAILWHPIPLITGAGKLELEAVVAPVEHHALIVNAFYTSTATAPIYVYDNEGRATQLPQQIFRGAGLELGYRYYRGRGGPRGLFAGLSLVAVAMFEHQGEFGNGSHTNYADLGAAIDAGYAAIVADRVALAVGLGVQALDTTKPIPPQQLPASTYADAGVVPRIVFGVGWAF
jgi:hypothetical protein